MISAKPGSSNELFIKNPHSIMAALSSRPKDVIEIVFPREKNEEWANIEVMAQQNKVRVRNLQADDRALRDRKNHGKAPIGRESSHGAAIRPKAPISIEKCFAGIEANTRGVWLALDCLQYPQNLGAIFRSAAFFGVKGILITTERSAPMTSTVYDIASGGVDAIPHVMVINLKQAFEKAKEAGLWILGTSEHAKQSLKQVKADRPWLLVVGNEEKGIRRLTEEGCDVMCSVPPVGDVVTSLNVSVATGILLNHLC